MLCLSRKIFFANDRGTPVGPAHIISVYNIYCLRIEYKKLLLLLVSETASREKSVYIFSCRGFSSIREDVLPCSPFITGARKAYRKKNSRASLMSKRHYQLEFLFLAMTLQLLSK